MTCSPRISSARKVKTPRPFSKAIGSRPSLRNRSAAASWRNGASYVLTSLTHVRFAPGTVPIVPLRPTAFSRLVANLLDNAIAYGAPPVDVSTRAEDGRIVLEIADRGPGIAPDQVERLKRPFTRASFARSNEGNIAGAGLGLAIVDRIARLHGGTFDLLARDGGGTVARVVIPATA